MTSSHPDTSLRDRKCIKPAFYAVYWHYPLPAADTHAKKISEKLWVCQDGFSETVFWCMSLSMLHYAPEDSTKQASEPLRYRSRTCFEQAEIIYSACGAVLISPAPQIPCSTQASEIPHSTIIRNAVTATPAFLRRPGTGHICNSQTIRHIQNSGVSAIPLKQESSDTLFSHSTDNQYITNYLRFRSPQKLPTSQHYERPVTSPVFPTTLPPPYNRDKKSAKIVTKVLRNGISAPKTGRP